MNTDTEKPKKITPPYISIVKMQKLLDLLSNRSFSQLTLDDLTARDFSVPDAFLALQGLRFLGFITEVGNVQNAQVLALKGEARTNGIKEIVEKAYSKLFERVKDLNVLSRDDLYNEFIAEYQLSPRLAKTALPLFLWLCREAGIQLSENLMPKITQKSNRKDNIRGVRKNHKVKSVQSEGEESVFQTNYHVYDISRVKLSIPKTPDTDLLILKGELSEITQKIQEFAEKAGLDKEKSEKKDSGEVA